MTTLFALLFVVLPAQTEAAPPAASPPATEAAPAEAATPPVSTPSEASATATTPAETTATTEPMPAEVAPPPHDEPVEIDGWKIVTLVGGRKLPDGRDTRDACGYMRTVIVERTVLVETATEKGQVLSKTATLVMPCIIGDNGSPVPGTPTLTFPDEPKADAKVAAKEPEAPLCKEGEKPKTKDELKKGEVACREPPPPRTCEAGEKPLPADKMPNGEKPCVELASERGVPFLKGELTHFGDVQLVNVRNSAGVAFGVRTFDSIYYAEVRPDVNLHFGPFSLGVGAPLRFEVADLSQLSATDPSSQNTVFANAGRFRTEDWDQIEDIVRPIRYLTWGAKEQNLYVDVNRVHSLTIGHGQLVRRYNPNEDIDEDNLFAAVDGYGDFGGVELMAGPWPVPRLAGGLAFIKPLGLFSDNYIAKSWSVGVSYVTDLNAPTTLERRINPADQRTQFLVDPSNQLVYQGRKNFVNTPVQGVGVDTEVKVFKTDNFDIKTYGDYSQLFMPGDPSGAFDAFSAGGATVGALLRMSFGKTPVRRMEEETKEVQDGKLPREMKAGHGVRFRLETRVFDPQYLPSYFNATYEIDRLQYGQTLASDPRTARGDLPTKIGFLASNEGEPWRAGYYTELSYAWVDLFGVTLAYEDAYPVGAADKPVRARNLAFHVESQGLGFLQLFATYHYRNFDDFSGLFSFGTDNEIVYAGGRLQLLPILFVNASAQRSFRVGFLADDQAQLRNDDDTRFSSVGFENVWGANLDVELGWQF